MVATPLKSCLTPAKKGGQPSRLHVLSASHKRHKCAMPHDGWTEPTEKPERTVCRFWWSLSDPSPEAVSRRPQSFSVVGGVSVTPLSMSARKRLHVNTGQFAPCLNPHHGEDDITAPTLRFVRCPLQCFLPAAFATTALCLDLTLVPSHCVVQEKRATPQSRCTRSHMRTSA